MLCMVFYPMALKLAFLGLPLPLTFSFCSLSC